MNGFIVCATRSMKDYASQVISHLSQYSNFGENSGSINGVDLLKTVRFSDGEMEADVSYSIRGKTVILFTSSARNEAGLSVEEGKIELYHTVDALKRSQAGKIIVFEPFVSCSRSDRATRRSSVGLWVHIKTLTSLGARHIVTFQLHSDKSRTMADPSVCAIDDIPAFNLLMRRLCDSYIKDRQTLETDVRNNWAFCSVDAGGEKIARTFANAFSAPLVVAHKQRDYSKANTIESVHILSEEALEGKSLWIVDDMIDTAGSVQTLIHALSPLKPKEINLVAVHALFSPPALERLRTLSNEGLLNRTLVTDSAGCPASFLQSVKGLEIVKSAELAAHVIKTIVSDESMSNLLEPFNASAYLSEPRVQ